MGSAGVNGSDELNQVVLVLVFDLLLLHAQVIVVLEVGVYHHLVQMTDNPNLGVSFHIVVGPLFQVSLSNKHLRFIHDLDKQFMVIFVSFDSAALGILD